MNLGDAVTTIAKRLGNRTDLNTRIKAEMVLAQAELEAARTLPWFLLDAENYVDLAADTERVSLPAGFIREYENGALWVEDTTDSTYTKLQKVALDDLRSVVSYEEDKVPAYYALAGRYFYLAPKPEAVTRLRLMFYGAADALTLDADTNAWLTYTPELLIAKTGMRMAQYLRSPELAAMFQAQYAEAAQAMEHADVARDMENFEACMGGA